MDVVFDKDELPAGYSGGVTGSAESATSFIRAPCGAINTTRVASRPHDSEKTVIAMARENAQSLAGGHGATCAECKLLARFPEWRYQRDPEVWSHPARVGVAYDPMRAGWMARVGRPLQSRTVGLLTIRATTELGPFKRREEAIQAAEDAGWTIVTEGA